MKWYQHPVFLAALGGALAATAVDRQAFAAFKTVQEFAQYSWSTAAFRFMQGFVIGAGSAAGLGWVVS